MTVKSSSVGEVFRRLQRKYAAPEAQDLLALGMYSPYLPEEARVGLIQEGTARLAGPEKEDEIRREGLETAAQAAGLTAAGLGATYLLDQAVRKGLAGAQNQRLQRVAASAYDALTLPGGVAHKDTDLLGGDALASRKSESILARLRNRGLNYKPTSTVNGALAMQPKNLFLQEEIDVMPSVTDRLSKMFSGVTPSAEELGKARKEWSGQTGQLSKRFPGWDRPGTLDRSDFSRIATALQSSQGGDARAATSILTTALNDDLVAAAATETPAGAAARTALGQVPKEKLTGLGPDRIMSSLEGGASKLRSLSAGLRAPPTTLARLAAKGRVSALLRAPVLSTLLSRGGLGALGVGSLAGIVGAHKRKEELEQLAENLPTDEDVLSELQARDRSTALALGRQYGAPGPLERATLRASRLGVSPEAVAALTTGVMLRAGS